MVGKWLGVLLWRAMASSRLFLDQGVHFKLRHSGLCCGGLAGEAAHGGLVAV